MRTNLTCEELFKTLEIRPAGINLFRVNNENPRTMFEIFSKSTIKNP